MWRLNDVVHKNQLITKEIKEEKKKKKKKQRQLNKNTTFQKLCKNISDMEFYRNTLLLQETIKSQINNLTLPLKQLDKEKLTKPKESMRKEI